MTQETALAELLRERRLTAGPADAHGRPTPLSYREVANLTDGLVSHQHLYAAETGFRRITDPAKLAALAKALGNVSYEEIMEAAGFGYDEVRGANAPNLERALAAHGLREGEIREVLGYCDFLVWRRDAPARPIVATAAAKPAVAKKPAKKAPAKKR